MIPGKQGGSGHCTSPYAVLTVPADRRSSKNDNTRSAATRHSSDPPVDVQHARYLDSVQGSLMAAPDPAPKAYETQAKRLRDVSHYLERCHVLGSPSKSSNEILRDTGVRLQQNDAELLLKLNLPSGTIARHADDRYRFIPRHPDIVSKESLEAFLERSYRGRFPMFRDMYKSVHADASGVPVAAICSAYPDFFTDAEELIRTDRAVIFSLAESPKEYQLFALSGAPESEFKPCSASVTKMFHETALPADIDELKREVQGGGMQSALELRDRRRAANMTQKEFERKEKDAAEKRARKLKRSMKMPKKLTNAHLVGLFGETVEVGEVAAVKVPKVSKVASKVTRVAKAGPKKSSR